MELEAQVGVRAYGLLRLVLTIFPTLGMHVVFEKCRSFSKPLLPEASHSPAIPPGFSECLFFVSIDYISPPGSSG